jgi:hypothetical protein
MKHRLIQSLADILIGTTILCFFPTIIAVIWLDPTAFWLKILATNFLLFAFGMLLHSAFEDHESRCV